MEKLTNIAKDSVSFQTRSTADLAYNVNLKNKQIMSLYGLTVDDIGNKTDDIKERMFAVSSVYKLVETDTKLHRDEILKVQAEAVELNRKYNLGLNEHFLLSANINSTYAMDATKAMDRAIARIVAWEEMNELQTIRLTMSLARQSDMISGIMTGGEGMSVFNAVADLASTQTGTLLPPGMTLPPIYGGQYQGDTPETRESSSLDQLMEFVGSQGFEHMISQGQYFSASGKLQQSSLYQGPEGQIVKSLGDIATKWNIEKQLYEREAGWKKIPDPTTALVNATIENAKAVNNMKTVLRQDISAGLAGFSSSAESQAYVAAGGGLAGLEKAAEAKAALEVENAKATKAKTDAALKAKGLQTLTVGGISYTVPANTTSIGSFTNPSAIPVNLSGVGQGGIVSGGGWSSSGWTSTSGGGWVSNQGTSSGGVASGNTGALASAQAAGYSMGEQFGGIIDEPIVGIGMHSGREWRLGESGAELVTPLNQVQGGGGLGNIIINIGNITREADYLKLKPLIQRWILEASSRRGMV